MKKRTPHFSSPLSPLSKMGTSAALDFFASWREINSLLQFLLHLVGTADITSEIAHKALIEGEDDPVKKIARDKQWKERKKAVDVLREQRQLLLEVILVRHIENYLNYLSSLLYEIFIQRPETLRSSEKIEVSDLLKHNTMDDIVRDIAERKVSSLSYSSLSNLAEFFSDRFGLSIASSEQLSAICEAAEIRNISVHNRCIINERYLSRTGCDSAVLGQKKELFIGYLDEIVPILADLVKSLDESARRKMKLKNVRFNLKKK